MASPRPDQSRLEITDENIQHKIAEIAMIAEETDLEKATVILQLNDGNVYMVNDSGRDQAPLPIRDKNGAFRSDGTLLVMKQAGRKELTGKLLPIFKPMGNAKKLVLSLLPRFWLDPCCKDPARNPGFLAELGISVSCLRDYIQDSPYTRRSINYGVLCPNCMLGIGSDKGGLPIEEAKEMAATWGSDHIHPTQGACKQIAGAIASDQSDTSARYNHPPREAAGSVPKKPGPDLSL